MKIYELKELIKRYGEKAPLKDVLQGVQGWNIYECPKCKGKGSNAENIECDLCNGIGYTQVEYKEKVEIVGYEPVK